MNPKLRNIIFYKPKSTVLVSNEVVYTAATFTEWAIAGAGTTKGATGIHLVADGANDFAYRTTALTGNTNYLLLYTVSEKDLDNSFILDACLTGATFLLTQDIGNNKAILLTRESITTNRLIFYAAPGNTNGKYIDFNNVRLIALPSGSQLETDAVNLTADQLAVNIPYYYSTGLATLSK